MAKMTYNELQAHKATHTKQNSWWVNDVRGIPLSRVCDECEDQVLDTYKPEVTGRGPGRYEDSVEEPIEPDDYY